LFEQLRRTLDELLERATKPEDRRAVISRMKNTLVQATMGLDEVRQALEMTKRKLSVEEKELVTVKRRKELAVGINDAETVTIAERYEKQHEERVRLHQEKLVVQTRELELAEREVSDMKAEIRAAMAGGGVPGGPLSSSPDEDPLDDKDASAARDELDALARERARTDRAAEVDKRLEELKRKMGK